MIAFSGVWDATFRRKAVAFAGIMALLGIAYIGSLATGSPFVIRFFI